MRALPSRLEVVMIYAVRAGLHFCDLGQHILFLDVPAGRYFTMATAWNGAFRAIVQGEPGGLDPSEVQRLQGARLIEPSDQAAERVFREVPAMPVKSLLDGRPQKGSGYWTTRIVWSQWRARRDLQRHGLQGLAREAAALSANVREPRKADEIVNRLGWASAQSTFILTKADQCLVRSVALMRLLRRRNIQASLVLGVTASPFSAHAWVQRGDVLLNDQVERIRTFRPIASF